MVERAARRARQRISALLVAPPPHTAPVIAVVSAAGAVVTVAAIANLDTVSVGVVALLVAAVLAEAFPVPIEGVAPGETSFAIVFIAATASLYGWEAAVLVGALTMLLVELRHWRPLPQLAFNISLYAVAGAAAGGVAAAMPEKYRIGVLAAVAFYLVNISVLSILFSRVRDQRALPLAKSFFLSTLAPFVVMAATTAILVELWRQSPFFALLLVPPLGAIVVYQRSLLAAMKRQRELDELKDEFIAVVSHELRTPLSSVYGGAVTLQREGLDEDARERIIAIIRKESARLAKLVDAVLWASRLDASKAEAQAAEFDANSLVEEVTASAAEFAPDNIEIRTDTNGGVSCSGDPEHVRRILANLVDNAVKYSPDGGTVTVTTRGGNGHVRFTVSDEGIGVPRGSEERIFEKFTRLDPEMQRRTIGGTGLGLYICRELVRQMGGQIWVTTKEGGGSTFTFELPAKGGRA